MLRTVAVLVGAASLCRIGVPSARLPAGLQSSAQTVEELPASCPVTNPSQPPFFPPAPYPSNGLVWVGSPKLWTDIPRSGTWLGLTALHSRGHPISPEALLVAQRLRLAQ